jgi:hypothetical protein
VWPSLGGMRAVLRADADRDAQQLFSSVNGMLETVSSGLQARQPPKIQLDEMEPATAALVGIAGTAAACVPLCAAPQGQSRIAELQLECQGQAGHEVKSLTACWDDYERRSVKDQESCRWAAQQGDREWEQSRVCQFDGFSQFTSAPRLPHLNISPLPRSPYSSCPPLHSNPDFPCNPLPHLHPPSNSPAAPSPPPVRPRPHPHRYLSVPAVNLSADPEMCPNTPSPTPSCFSVPASTDSSASSSSSHAGTTFSTSPTPTFAAQHGLHHQLLHRLIEADRREAAVLESLTQLSAQDKLHRPPETVLRSHDNDPVWQRLNSVRDHHSGSHAVMPWDMSQSVKSWLASDLRQDEREMFQDSDEC